jgi:nucleotide-binding universal stress UspA family protein
LTPINAMDPAQGHILVPGSNVADAETAHEREALTPALETVPMFKHILIATDGSELAERAAAQGFALAKALDAKVTAVTVSEPWAAVVSGEAAFGFPPDDYEKGAAEAAQAVLGRVAELAKAAGVACTAVHVKDHFPDEGIVGAAKEKGCDLIVMASHGRRGFAKLLLGSVATRVLTLSPVPVLVCR